jgi:hypothetical protein
MSTSCSPPGGLEVGLTVVFDTLNTSPPISNEKASTDATVFVEPIVENRHEILIGCAIGFENVPLGELSLSEALPVMIFAEAPTLTADSMRLTNKFLSKEFLLGWA